MCATATLACLFAIQQLHVEPVPLQVGDSARVVAAHAADATKGSQAADSKAAGVAVEVTLPEGDRRALGVTGDDGVLAFVPESPGPHVFAAVIDGVRCVAPVTVGGPRRAWWLLFGSAPLALALSWLQLRRARDRRGSAPCEGPRCP